MTELEQAAIDLYKARMKRDKTKKVLREYREEYGSCKMEIPVYGVQECYREQKPEDQWCEVCQGSQPLYLERKEAGNKVASSMRRLMNLCSKANISN